MAETVVKTSNSPSLIIFIGMMGAGKTTIGRALARELGRDFIDLDHEIVRRCGVAIPTIFDIEGEEGFRRRETDTLADVVKQANLVLATGGGAILREENRALLQQGLVITSKPQWMSFLSEWQRILTVPYCRRRIRKRKSLNY